MQITLTRHHIEVNSSLRNYVNVKLTVAKSDRQALKYKGKITQH